MPAGPATKLSQFLRGAKPPATTRRPSQPRSLLIISLLMTEQSFTTGRDLPAIGVWTRGPASITTKRRLHRIGELTPCGGGAERPWGTGRRARRVGSAP